MTDRRPLCGSIQADDGAAIDGLLEMLTSHLRSQGVLVAGVLQRRAAFGDSCCADMGLELISTGETIEISQPLGSGSRGCRLDPRGLAEVTARLQTELEARPDLLILNRFGKGEQDGEGFRQLIAQAAGSSIPILTAVRPSYRQAWQSFAGDLAVDLPPDEDLILKWCLDVVSPPMPVAANA